MVSAEIGSRLKRFDMARRRYLGGSLAAGAWAAELCYDGEGGLYVDAMDPRYLRWADGFLEPHAPRNPWVMTIARMPLEQVKRRKGWKVPDDLQPDSMRFTDEGSWSAPVLDSAGNPTRGSNDTLVTVVKYRCRFEDYGRRPKDDSLPLDDAMHHLACPGCGWTSPPAVESGQPYPKRVERGCPDCGGDVGLVERVYNEPAADSGSKRMVICAPFSGHEEPFYEGAWDFDYPTFPVLWLESYAMPHRSGGQSDTQVLKTPVLSSNAVLRLSYETALKSKPFFYAQRGSIQNAKGSAFGFDPIIDGDVMWATGDTPRPPQVIQGTGINPSIFALYDRLQSVFRTNESTSETAMSAEQLAQTTASALQQQTETGNVVVDDHGSMLYDAESLLLTCMYAALRELPSQPRRYQDDSGQWQFANLGGPLMPRAEIRVGSGRLLDTLDKDELESYQALVTMPPERRKGFARFAHISPEVMGQIEADDAEAMQRMAQQQQMAGPPGMPPGPMGAGGAPPMMPPMINAGGMQ